MREKIVIALGGNALQSGKEAATAEAQLKTVKETAERIAEICERGSEIAVGGEIWLRHGKCPSGT